eukprot:4815157-Amphidinium_carterae.5
MVFGCCASFSNSPTTLPSLPSLPLPLPTALRGSRAHKCGNSANADHPPHTQLNSTCRNGPHHTALNGAFATNSKTAIRASYI